MILETPIIEENAIEKLREVATRKCRCDKKPEKRVRCLGCQARVDLKWLENRATAILIDLRRIYQPPKEEQKDADNNAE